MENKQSNTLRFEGLNKFFGKKKVLDDLSGIIQSQALTSLIGPNGAGKSTLLGIMSRLMKQDEGTVFFLDKPLHSFKTEELAKKLSILKQANTIELKLTVKDLVAFGRFPYCQGRLTKADWEKVDEALAFADMKSLEDAYLDELSGGQRQRAFIALVVAQDTDFVFLDEPLNNLDMKHAVQVMKMLRRLVDELGKTIVIVIHEINFAAQYSDRIIALKDGQIRYNDTANAVIQQAVLTDIFDMEFAIMEHNNKKICNYFNL